MVIRYNFYKIVYKHVFFPSFINLKMITFEENI